MVPAPVMYSPRRTRQPAGVVPSRVIARGKRVPVADSVVLFDAEPDQPTPSFDVSRRRLNSTPAALALLTAAWMTSRSTPASSDQLACALRRQDSQTSTTCLPPDRDDVVVSHP